MNQHDADVVAARYTATLDAPAADVWPYFDWPNLERMLGGGLFIAVHYAERRAIAGAVREVELASGARLTEVLEACEPQGGRLAYRILDHAALPVRDYRGEVTVAHEGPRRTRVDFSCRCRLVAIDAAAWQQAYAAMQAGFIAHIGNCLAAHRT